MAGTLILGSVALLALPLSRTSAEAISTLTGAQKMKGISILVDCLIVRDRVPFENS